MFQLVPGLPLLPPRVEVDAVQHLPRPPAVPHYEVKLAQDQRQPGVQLAVLQTSERRELRMRRLLVLYPVQPGRPVETGGESGGDEAARHPDWVADHPHRGPAVQPTQALVQQTLKHCLQRGQHQMGGVYSIQFTICVK